MAPKFLETFPAHQQRVVWQTDAKGGDASTTWGWGRSDWWLMFKLLHQIRQALILIQSHIWTCQKMVCVIEDVFVALDWIMAVMQQNHCIDWPPAQPTSIPSHWWILTDLIYQTSSSEFINQLLEPFSNHEVSSHIRKIQPHPSKPWCSPKKNNKTPTKYPQPPTPILIPTPNPHPLTPIPQPPHPPTFPFRGDLRHRLHPKLARRAEGHRGDDGPGTDQLHRVAVGTQEILLDPTVEPVERCQLGWLTYQALLEIDG